MQNELVPEEPAPTGLAHTVYVGFGMVVVGAATPGRYVKI
jgi:hypothetical protein